MRALGWVAAIGVLCTGCFDSRVVEAGDAAMDAGPAVDPALVREARAVLERVDAERCRHAVDCAPLYEPSGYTEGRLCHPAYRDIDEQVAAVARGDAILDADAVARCVAHLASFEGCSERTAVDDDPCSELVRGTHPPGTPCEAARGWCDPSGYCDECTAACTRRRLAGERCGSAAWCAADLRCEGGTCEPIDTSRSRALGDACAFDEQCPVAALCLDGVCRALPPSTEIDGPCFGDRWCSEGQWCSYEAGVAGTCQAPRAEGGRCQADRSCVSGLVCVLRTCRAPGGLGAPCGRSEHCGPDAPYCAGTGTTPSCQRDAEGMRCTPATAVALSATPTGCPEGYGCVAIGWLSGECRRLAPVGGSCTADAQCPARARCEAGLCHAISDPGGACDAERLCPDLFVCARGVCAPLPGVGEPCREERACLRGTCRDGTCTLSALGEPCADGWQCDGGWCSDGRCAAFREAGPDEPCSEGVTCGEGSYCNERLGTCIERCADPTT